MADDYVSSSYAAPDAAPFLTADAAPAAAETPSAPAPDDAVPDGDDTGDESSDDQQPVSKHNLDRRFRRLTGRLRERETEIQRLTTQVETLLRIPGQVPVREPAAPDPAAPVRQEDYPTYDAFDEARMAQKVQQLVADQFRQQEQTAEQARIEAAAAQLAQTYETRVTAARAKYPDYDEVIEDATFPVSQPLLEELRTSEMGPDLAYYLATRPEEGTRLSQLPPRALARELGKLEAQVSTPPTPAPSPAAPSVRPVATPRPRPLAPVSGNQGQATTPVFDPATASYEDYRRWRDAGGGRD